MGCWVGQRVVAYVSVGRSGSSRLSFVLIQAKAVMAFMEAVQEKTLRTTVSLTASRGRGKSAAVGLCLAGAIAFGYSNIYVTAPSPENLETVFDFVKRGLGALKYAEHMDYEVRTAGHHGGAGHQQGHQQGQADAKAIVRITVHRQHRQTIQYIAPHEHEKLSQVRPACFSFALSTLKVVPLLPDSVRLRVPHISPFHRLCRLFIRRSWWRSTRRRPSPCRW